MSTILTDEECEQTQRAITQLKDVIDKTCFRLTIEHEMSSKQIENSLATSETLLAQYREDVARYHALKQGALPLLDEHNMAMAVVWCRISSGLTQQQFAALRGVPVARVQRDERNEYFNITQAEVEHFLRLLGYRLRTVIRYQVVPVQEE